MTTKSAVPYLGFFVAFFLAANMLDILVTIYGLQHGVQEANPFMAHILARAALPHKRFYDLRHTAASLLLAQGVDMKVISEILGHASIRTTMDVYTHLTRAQHTDAAAKMDQIFQAG